MSLLRKNSFCGKGGTKAGSSKIGYRNPKTSNTGSSEDTEEDIEPMKPKRFFFSDKDYALSCKISSRCDVGNTVEFLDNILSRSEKQWFSKHPQFKHIWHMFRQGNRKLTGMWMLLVRTVWTEKKRVCWFVVNGVPVRYSMKEHALICGLDCHDFPPSYERKGSLDFVEKMFGRKSNIEPAQVEELLDSMEGECGGDRLRIAVLFFLSKIIRGRSKVVKRSVDPLLLRYVADLELCKTFPWGRLTFEDSMQQIFHMMTSLDGTVQPTWTFPGFIIPLEVLAFECIPNLCKEFRVDVRDAHKSCPRMCKKRFKATGMKGYPYSEILDVIGSTKDIRSCLEPQPEEIPLLACIMNEHRDDEMDKIDPIADAWDKRVDLQKKQIWWEDLYNADIASRKNDEHMEEEGDNLVPPAKRLRKREKNLKEEQNEEPKEKQQEEKNCSCMKELEDKVAKMMKLMEDRFKDMKLIEEGFKEIKFELAVHETRLTSVEGCVNNERNGRYGMDFQYGSAWPGETSGFGMGGGSSGFENVGDGVENAGDGVEKGGDGVEKAGDGVEIATKDGEGPHALVLYTGKGLVQEEERKEEEEVPCTPMVNGKGTKRFKTCAKKKCSKKKKRELKPSRFRMSPYDS